MEILVRIISDCRVCSILKTLSGCLYASRNCSEFVYWSWRSKWIVQPYLPCCDRQPFSRVILNSSEERIISFERPKTNHDKLPRENNSLITTRQITLHIICIKFQVLFSADYFWEYVTLNAVYEIFKLHILCWIKVGVFFKRNSFIRE